MSYNIDYIQTIIGELTITKKRFRKLLKKYRDELPEENLLCCLEDDLNNQMEDWEDAPDEEIFSIKEISWYGEGSGYSYDEFEDTLKQTMGYAELVLIWEGGDSITGLRVKDGKVTKCKVMFTLQEE